MTDLKCPKKEILSPEIPEENRRTTGVKRSAGRKAGRKHPTGAFSPEIPEVKTSNRKKSGNETPMGVFSLEISEVKRRQAGSSAGVKRPTGTEAGRKQPKGGKKTPDKREENIQREITLGRYLSLPEIPGN